MTVGGRCAYIVRMPTPKRKRTTHQKHGGWRPGAGRPAGERPKVKPVSVMLTAEEKLVVEEAMRYMGYRDRSPFIRHAVLHYSREVLGD